MIWNYLLIAIRIIKKNTLFSVINVLGLAIGLASSIIIYLWVFDELSYDRFHTNYDRIFRIERDMVLDGQFVEVPITSPPLAPQIMQDYPAVKLFTRFVQEDVMIEDANKNLFKEQMHYADSSFFKVFTIELVQGNADACLTNPFTVAISQSFANKYFGDNAQIGSLLKVNYNGQIKNYTVTAIFKDFPQNSHIEANVIGSFISLYNLRHEMMMTGWMSSFHYSYIVLNDDVNANDFQIQIQDMVDKYFGPDIRNYLNIDNPRDFLKLKLMPISQIHLNANRTWEFKSPGSKTSVIIFSLISILLIVIAGINFMNLSSARASRRALEVGVRKASGASKTQLVWQFLGESILFSFLGLTLSLLFIEIVAPYFSDFTGKNISTFLLLKGWNLPLLIFVWLATAILSGLYPAFILSSYKPIEVLKGNKSSNGSQLFRKILVIGQFAISVGLIICALSVYRQLQYIYSKDVGYNRDGLIDISVENRSNFRSFEAFKNDLLKISEVKHVTRSLVIPTDLRYTDNPYLVRNSSEKFFPIVNRMDEHFIPTFEIRMAAGTNFSVDMISDTSIYYIINESALKMFGFSNPHDALDQEIGILSGMNNETRDWGKIVGVCEDFNYQPLTEIIKPMVMNSSLYGLNHITVRVDETRLDSANVRIKEIWDKHFPGQLYSSTFVSQKFDSLHLTEKRLQVILLIFTFLSIFVACLGLLGLSAFSAEQRTKEIGIRKTLGAELHQIVWLMSSEFSKLILLAILITTPIAYLIINSWLRNFPYHREIEIWVFLVSALLGWVTAMATVIFQVIKAGMVTPVQILKYE